MAGETVITVIGNLTSDPELRFTPSGAPVASFTIASTPRTFNRQANDWQDGNTLFLRSSCWRDMAENVAETLTKGMRVIAQGRLEQRSYTTRDGENRTVVELAVTEIGPSLRRAKARVERNAPGGHAGGSTAATAGYTNPATASWANGEGASAGGSADDPWATSTASTDFGSEPPF